MPTYTEITDSLFDQIVSSIETAEDRALAAVSSGNAFAKKLLPAATKVEGFGVKFYPPARSFPLVGKLPSLPKSADRLETNTEFAERTIKTLARKVIELIPETTQTGVFADAAPKAAPVAKRTTPAKKLAVANKPVVAKKTITAKKPVAVKKTTKQ